MERRRARELDPKRKAREHDPLRMTRELDPKRNAREHQAAGVGVYCWFSNPGIVVQAGVAVLHRPVADAIECPFQWVWQNANTPPNGNSTIEAAIRVID